jgi:uncharacterized membrane protein HdeD (DUF308 family)
LLLEEGLASIASGVLTFVWPAIMALVLLYLIAVWAIVTGVIEIAAAFSGRLLVAQEGTLALAGVLSLLLGTLLVVRPGVGLLSLT